MEHVSAANQKLSIKKIAIILVYALIALLPFLGIFPSMGMLKELICILICTCAIVNRQFRFNWSFVCVIVYTLSIIIGVIGIEELTLSARLDIFRYRCMFAISFCMLFNGFSFCKDELLKIGERVLQIVFCTGLVVALIGIIEFCNPTIVRAIYGEALTPHLSVVFEGVSERRLVSIMSNPINLGLQMSLSIVAGFYFAHRNPRKKSNLKLILYYLAIVLFVWVAIYSYSRTAYVVIIGVILAFYFIQILFEKGQNKKKIALLVGICSVIVLFAVFLLVNQNIAARFSNISIYALLNNTRFSRAYDAFQNSENNFWNLMFGYGAGRVISDSMQYVFEFGYASLLFESGVLGLFLFGSLIRNCMKITILAIRRKLSVSLFCLTFFGFIVAFCFAMIAEDVYFQLPVCLYFWFSVFMINTMGKIVVDEHRKEQYNF